MATYVVICKFLGSVIRECLYFSISPSKSITPGSNKFCVAAPVDIS